MTTNAAMPIGIIDESTPDGAVFTMTRPQDHRDLQPDAAVTVWNHHQGTGATARLQGRVTEVGATTASFLVTLEDIDPGWPAHIDPKGAGNPVYLAIPGTYVVDLSRTATPQEFEMLLEFARQHQEMTGIEPAAAAYVLTPGPGPHYHNQNTDQNAGPDVE